jgi:hypothetical protein
MLSGKLGELFPSHVDISGSISQVNFTAVRTLSQIGEICQFGAWAGLETIILQTIATY